MLAWRNWAFVALFLALVMALGRSHQLIEPFGELHHAETAVSVTADNPEHVSKPPAEDHKFLTYEFGSVEIMKQVTIEIPPPVDRVDPTVNDETPQPVTPQLSERAPLTEGDWPALEVDYDTIGFESYVTAIESVGQLFLLVRHDAQLSLGPRVSLGRNGVRFLQKSNDAATLSHPHLVAGPEVQRRLARLKLPSNAILDSVVLSLNPAFESDVWQSVQAVISQANINFDDVDYVSGRYTDHGGSVYLELDYASLLDSDRSLPINTRIAVR
jgi:hypothetical protein